MSTQSLVELFKLLVLRQTISEPFLFWEPAYNLLSFSDNAAALGDVMLPCDPAVTQA